MDSLLDKICRGIGEFLGSVVNWVSAVFGWLWNMLLTGELWELFCQLVLLLILFGVGCFFARLARLDKLYYTLHEDSSLDSGISPNLIRGLISMALSIWALICIHNNQIQMSDVFQFVFPTGDYIRVGNMIDESQYQSILLKFNDALIREVYLTVITILPVLVLDLVDAWITRYCRSKEYTNQVISAVLRFVYSIAVFVLLFCYENPNTKWFLSLFQSVGRGIGISSILFYVLLMVLLGATCLNIFGNDPLIAIFGFNIAIRILKVPLLPWQQIVYVVLCFVCGTVSSLIRDRVYDEELDKDNIFGLSLIYALISMAVCTGVAMLLLWGAKALLG